MASTEMEVDNPPLASVSTAQEDGSSSILDEPGTVKEENIDEKEEGAPSESTSKASDGKGPTDPKNANVKIVRASKRMKLDIDAGHSSDKKETKDDPEAEAKMMRSYKRSCELWSMEDKNTFFKALNEFGKDFDALQSYFLVQGKKKGLTEKMIKNKEQIRHFYYRTWMKIAKHIKFSEDVKKTSQELYGLINYGELRRKLPRMHEKVQSKLSELVYWGSTQVRLRGKTMRIKTPICRALRKLNQLEGWQEDIKLPSRVTIELRPGNNVTWWRVQALSMNPRVRTLVPIQRRLSSILSYLQQRWKPWRAKTSSDVESSANAEGKGMHLLRVTPQEGCKISLPVVNLGEYLTSNSVSLNSYENRLGLKSSKTEMLGSVQYVKGIGKKGVKKLKGDKRLSVRTDDVPDNSDIDLPESSATPTLEKPSISGTAGSSTATESQPAAASGFPGRETIDRIRLGWNVEEANTITVGDLFLMFGRDSKIILEYWWEPPAPEASAEKPSPIENLQNNSLSLALQKLLSIAKHSYGTSKGYDNVSGSNETVISSRIPSTQESTFRRPLIPQAYHKMGAPEAFQSQLDKYKSRFSRKGRVLRQRNLVVQRVLPSTPVQTRESTIQPETRTITVDGKIVTMTIIPPAESLAEESDGKLDSNVPESTEKHFLEDLESNEKTDHPVKVTNSNSSITSAMQILNEGGQQWLSSDADVSLSSFLGLLGESPVKGSQRSQVEVPMIEIIRPSSDVANMPCIMGESSVDYTGGFANFASQITAQEQKK